MSIESTSPTWRDPDALVGYVYSTHRLTYLTLELEAVPADEWEQVIGACYAALTELIEIFRPPSPRTPQRILDRLQIEERWRAR